jgi:hypothetical protein
MNCPYRRRIIRYNDNPVNMIWHHDERIQRNVRKSSRQALPRGLDHAP